MKRRETNSLKQRRAKSRSWTIFRLRGAYALFCLDEIGQIDESICDIIRASINELIKKIGAVGEEDRTPPKDKI